MKDNRELETLTLYNNELVGTIPSPVSAKMSRIYLQVSAADTGRLHTEKHTRKPHAFINHAPALRATGLLAGYLIGMRVQTTRFA